ncbi:MAG: cyclase [Peptococcaceae bacterium 1109]|nr:MAG: cyclase [Peptococcaceae bacterium 1109]
MRIWDISMPVHAEMPVWKGKDEKRPHLIVTRDFQNGKGGRETRLVMDAHTGTHVDAPLHFIQGGKTLDQIPMEQLIRKAKVIDLSAIQDVILPEHFAGHGISRGDFVLFKTLNSTEPILERDFVYISGKAARALVDMGVVGVGIDSLGVERDQPDHATHLALLSAGVIIIEGLRLDHVPAGEYLMIAAPLRIMGVEAAPARVILTDLLDPDDQY